MGAWGEGLLENDTAGDLEVFWNNFVVAGRKRDPTFWKASRIAELFRFCYFRGYDGIQPEKPEQAEELLAVAALFHRQKFRLPPKLKALVESAANHELRPTRLEEWANPRKRKAALEQVLRDIGGRRRRPPKARRRRPTEEQAEINRFMKRAPHWIAVVQGERSYDDAYDSAEPAFVKALTHFCFAGTQSEDQEDERRAIIARLKCLGYVAGWMLNLPSADILRLIEAAAHVTSPRGPQYAWAAQVYAS